MPTIGSVTLEAADTAAAKRFYVDHGFTVSRSFGRKYVEFDAQEGSMRFALYGRRALAKDAGVPADGGGAHRLAITSDAAPFIDPDGFMWEGTTG